VITITGTNDVVSITSGAQAGSVTEDAAPQQASGMISFNDADLIDVHAASFAPHAGALGVFALTPVSESASTEGAHVGWTYTVDNNVANHLAAGESVTETYTVKVDDQHGSFTTQDIVITITGTNDVVSIIGGAQSGSVVEDAAPLQANGMISFNDADLIDVHTASFQPHAGALGVFALAPVSESASTENGQVGWTYTVDNGAANHLAAGESVSETYTVKVDDLHGSFTTQDVVITISGTNDVVSITSGAQSGSVAEDAVPQQASGTISFNDADLIDVHAASFDPHAGALGVFSLAPVAESAATEGGQVGWTYTVDNGAANHLAAGESVTETYTVRVDDQHGSFTTQDVVITISGTNDVVSITSGAQTGSVVEDAAPQQAGGMISFNDADLIDVHMATFEPNVDALGVFALAPVSESASTEDGELGWTYTVDNGAANHLAAGESITETYTVKVDDQHGSFTTQDVVITITGTNDVVSITSGAQSGSVVEDAAPQQANGTISFNDADLIDVHAASFAPHAGALGVFALVSVSESASTENGQVGWTYTVDNGAADHLAAGESVTETYTVKVDDQHGSFTTQEVVITIAGTNDVVSITSGAQSGSVVEDAAAQQASGMISFNDADLVDVHTASFQPHAGALGVFAL
ncbi:VCBS domain-containing protein, partial [Pseudoduganella violaceinigra]|uniref:VCBS domain-containing protein n=1 Tax=Pseudoduganella violaceinigra TaxID=246602 RepID=UPI001B7FE63D